MTTRPATVRAVVFLGEMMRYGLPTPSGKTLLVKQRHRAGNALLAPASTRLVA